MKFLTSFDGYISGILFLLLEGGMRCRMANTQWTYLIPTPHPPTHPPEHGWWEQKLQDGISNVDTAGTAGASGSSFWKSRLHPLKNRDRQLCWLSRSWPTEGRRVLGRSISAANLWGSPAAIIIVRSTSNVKRQVLTVSFHDSVRQEEAGAATQLVFGESLPRDLGVADDDSQYVSEAYAVHGSVALRQATQAEVRFGGGEA